MAQGNPSLPDIPGYDVRVSGGSSIPSIDPYTQVNSPLQKQFAQFSSTLMQYAGRKSDEANEKAIQEGRAWRYKSQKTFNEAVKAGEIDATQNPWFTVGALEVDGSMAATDLTGKINAGWSAIVADSNDPRGRDPEAFTQYYEQEVGKYVDTAEVDSHYWQNAFFKSVTSWHNQKASSELAGSRKRLFTHESTRAVNLIGSHLKSYTEGEDDALKEAQDLIESLRARGMWNQPMQQSMADHLNKLRQKVKKPGRADDFYNGLRTGPEGGVKLSETPIFENSELLQSTGINAHRSAENQVEFREARAEVYTRASLLKDSDYVQGKLLEDASWLATEFEWLTTAIEANHFTPQEWERLKINMGLSRIANEQLAAQSAADEARIPYLAEFYSRLDFLGDEEYWISEAKKAGATGADIPKVATELQQKEENALWLQSQDFIEFQDDKSIIEVQKRLANSRKNMALEMEALEQEYAIQQSAQTTYNVTLAALTFAPMNATAGAGQGSVHSLGERIDERFKDPNFAAQMKLLGISASDIRKDVDRKQRDILLGLWGDEENLRQYAAEAGIKNAGELGVDDLWHNLAMRVVDMRGEDMPAFRRALHQQAVQFFNSYEAIDKTDAEAVAEFYNTEVGITALRNVELAYRLSSGPDQRQFGTQQYVFGDGNVFINQYITERTHAPNEAPQDVLTRMITQGVKPTAFLPEKQLGVLAAMLDEKTDINWGDDGIDTSLGSQGLVILQTLSGRIGNRLKTEGQLSGGLDPVSGFETIADSMLSPVIISGSGNLFMPDGPGEFGAKLHDWSEQKLEWFGDFIMDQEFEYDSTSTEFKEQMGQLAFTSPAAFAAHHAVLRRMHTQNFDTLAVLNVDKANIMITPHVEDGRIVELRVIDATDRSKFIPPIKVDNRRINNLVNDFENYVGSDAHLRELSRTVYDPYTGL